MSIIGTFPTTIANGQVEDATVVMSLFAWIQSQTNGNACPATTGSAVLKGDGAGGTVVATAGTDYVIPSGTVATANALNAANSYTISDLTCANVTASGSIFGNNVNFGNSACTNITASGTIYGNVVNFTTSTVLQDSSYQYTAYPTYRIGKFQNYFFWNNGSDRMFLYDSGTLALPTGTQASTDNSTNVATTAMVQSAGVGGNSQSWQNMTGSRALGGGPYTNGTGKPIQVIVTNVYGGAGTQASTVTVAGSVIGSIGYSGGGCTGNISFIVPAGATYSAQTAGGVSLSTWYELR